MNSEELTSFPALALPSFDFDVEDRGGDTYIYDRLRKRWLLLTPEEWVRQHFTHFLSQYRGYPEHAITCETVLPHTSKKGRTDTVIFGAKGRPWAIVEYKAAHIRLGEGMWSQLMAYNLTYRTDLVCLTNGMQQIVCLFHDGAREYTYLREFPHYLELKKHYSSNDDKDRSTNRMKH